MNIYSISLFGFSFGMALTAIATLVKNRSPVSVRFFIFSLSAIGWGFPFAFFIGQDKTFEVALLLSKVSYAFAVFIPITWVHFIFAFIRQKEPFKYFYLMSYAIACILLCLCFTNLIIVDMQPILNFSHWVSPGKLYWMFVLFYFTLVPYAFYHLVKAFNASEPSERSQLMYLIAAMFSAFVPGTATFLPVFNIPFPQHGLVLMLLYPILLEIALNKFGLFDVEEVVAAFRREKLAALGTISASINHEIRNPLYVVNGLAEAYIEKLDEGSSKDFKNASREAMEKISEQSTRAMDIIKRFSSFAKQNVDTEFNPEFVELSEALKTVVPLVHHELDTSDIVLTEQVPSDLPKVKADLRHLEEILFNLIVNGAQAIKGAEKPGEIKISARVERNEVVIEVSDDGPGIAEDNLNQVFEPFHTSKDEGTGLGLYITKQLVEKNGGRLKVESTLGKQTTFSVRFKA